MGSRRLLNLLPALGRANSSRSTPAWSRPLIEETGVRWTSTVSAEDVESDAAAPADDTWWQEVQGASGGGGDGGSIPPPARRFDRPDVPDDEPRTLRDYQKMVVALTRRKRAYLIRDILDEMALNGVRPDRFVLQTGLFACMKSRKLGDAMFFFEEMKRRGMPPDSVAYGSAISACGRAGQLGRMLDLRDEMLRAGLPMTHNIRLALLNAFSEAGRMAAAQELFDEIVAAGHPADEFAFAGLANCYRHMPQKVLPADTEQQLVGLLDTFKQARADSQQAHADADADADAADYADYPEGGAPAERLEERGADRKGPYNPLLVVANAVLNSLATLGHHKAAVALFQRMGEEGLSPDHTTYSNIVRSYVAQALGRHRQPSNERLTEMLDERMRDLDLQPYIEQVLAEDASLADALAAAGERGGSGAPDASAAPPAADDAEAADALQPAAISGDAAGGHDETQQQQHQPAEEQQPAERQRQRQHGQRLASLSEAQLQQMVRHQARSRARSRLRFDIFREHLDVDAWYEALHMFQQVLDRGLMWGPDITYSMLKASLDLQAAGVEHALDVAHTVMDTFDRQGLFVDVEHGTEVLMLAVRRDVGDLSLAHRVYDSMRGTQRVPKTACMHKYMRAVAQREPDAKDRLLELCTRICSDPDKSSEVVAMKREAYQRKQQLLAAWPELEREQRERRRQQDRQHRRHSRVGR